MQPGGGNDLLSLEFSGTIFIGMRVIGIEKHDLDTWKKLSNDGEQFLRIKVSKTPIKEKDLPLAFLKLGQRIGSSQRLLYGAAASVKAVQNLLPKSAVGAGNQRSARTEKCGNRQYRAHCRAPSPVAF
jgi:hypothetical protein